MEITCKQRILDVLKEFPNGIAGGILEERVSQESIHKGSTVSRTARLMWNDGLLQRRIDKGFVEYRLS